jgi:hypothetical protein
MYGLRHVVYTRVHKSLMMVKRPKCIVPCCHAVKEQQQHKAVCVCKVNQVLNLAASVMLGLFKFSQVRRSAAAAAAAANAAAAAAAANAAAAAASAAAAAQQPVVVPNTCSSVGGTSCSLCNSIPLISPMRASRLRCQACRFYSFIGLVFFPFFHHDFLTLCHMVLLLFHPSGLGLKEDLLRSALDESLVTVAEAEAGGLSGLLDPFEPWPDVADMMDMGEGQMFSNV